MSFRGLRSAVVALALAWVAAPSGAATICVNPSKPACAATIQAGVTAANAGDTVAIAKGFYNENVAVPGGKDGLVIKGSKSVVLDGDDPLTGDSLVIGSANVTVLGLTIRNGNGAGIVANADGAWIQGVTITGTDGDCIDISANDATVAKNVLDGCGDNAIDASGDDIDIVGNKISHCDNSCMEITGNRVIIEKNSGQITEDSYMIDLTGDAAEIVGNTLDNSDSELINSNGANILITGNKLTNGAGGIAHTGANPVITRNLGKNLHGDDGIEVTCATDCSSGLVEANKLEDISDDSGGINVTGNAAGLAVRKNSIARVEDNPIDVDGSASVAVDSNKSTRSGGDSGEACIRVGGTGGHMISNNRGSDCHGDGIEVSGTGHQITGNQLTHVLENGILLTSGSGHVVNNNKVQGANGSGLAVESAVSSSTADGNTVKRVRNGLCNKSGSTTVSNHSASQTDTADEIGGGGACPI